MSAEDWTQERLDTLRTLVTKGMSTGQIAKELQGIFSRNAIIGKVHRLGLTLSRAQVAKTPKLPKPEKPPRPARSVPARISHRPSAPEPQAGIPVMQMGWPKPMTPTAVPFIDRAPIQCAMPLWDDETPATERMVCGATPLRTRVIRDGQGRNIERTDPYCAACCRIAFDSFQPKGRTQ